MTSLPLAAGCPWLRSASRLRQVAHWAKWFTNATEAAESKAVKTHNQAVENLVATGFTPPEVEIGRSRNWPKSKLAEVEQWFLLCFFFLSFLFFLLLCFFTSVLFSCSYSSPLLFVFCSVSVFVRKTTPNVPKWTPRERKKIEICGGRRETKARNFGAPLPPPFETPPFGNSKKLAEIEIGRSRNWPKSTLAAEVDHPPPNEAGGSKVKPSAQERPGAKGIEKNSSQQS